MLTLERLNALPALLLPWFSANKRALPWRADREPYHVWLSEIMLQQTRVEAVRGYYSRFLERLPTVQALAEAKEDTLMKLWEGLGYYSRARNLQKAARLIVEERGGEFPRTLEELRALPGVGSYTAGAIASICFELPEAAVDGNVLRVLSRLCASDAPVTDASVREKWRRALGEVYPAGHCGDFTQAMMELGATVCLPNGRPLCQSCPLSGLCLAQAQGKQQLFPVKAEKKPRRREQRTVFVLRQGERLALCKRPEKGLLAGLWQLPDVPGELTAAQALSQAERWGLHPTGIERVVHREHIFTHVHWLLTGVYLTCAEAGDFRWATPEELRQELSLPTAYRQFLEE